MPEALAFVRRVFAQALSVGRSEWRFLAIVIAVDAVPNAATELLPRDAPGLLAILTLVTLYLQLLVTFRILERLGATPPDYSRVHPTDGRYPAAFVVSVFATLGVLLGLVVLIVPGVLLMALWSLSMPALAAERLGATAAMARSWQLVRPRIGTVLLLCAVWIALYIPLIFGVFFAGFVMDDPATSLFMILDVTLSVLMIAGAVLWATAFVAIRNDSLIGGDA